jgi:hypothetical protein
MSRSKRKNQEKDQLDLQNAIVPNSGKIRWHQIHELGGTEFPRISKGCKRKLSQISQDKLYFIQNQRRLSKYSLVLVVSKPHDKEVTNPYL